MCRKKKLFNTLTKAQNHYFIFLICCIISKKTPIIQGPGASGKSHLLNVVSILLGQKANLYQMNSNTGMSKLTGQKVIKKDLMKKKKISEAYENIKNLLPISKNDKPFKEMLLKDYKKIIEKIDEKLKEDKLDKKEIANLKKQEELFLLLFHLQVDLNLLILRLSNQ